MAPTRPPFSSIGPLFLSVWLPRRCVRFPRAGGWRGLAESAESGGRAGGHGRGVRSGAGASGAHSPAVSRAVTMSRTSPGPSGLFAPPSRPRRGGLSLVQIVEAARGREAPASSQDPQAGLRAGGRASLAERPLVQSVHVFPRTQCPHVLLPALAPGPGLSDSGQVWRGRGPADHGLCPLRGVLAGVPSRAPVEGATSSVG